MKTMVCRSNRLADADSTGAFTRLELIVVLVVLVLLAVVQIPAFGKSHHQTRIARCVGNLRQLVLAFEIYANENHDRLPSGMGGYWAWDISWSLGTNMSRYGATEQTFYCPAVLDNMDALWNYAPPTFRVIGYATTLPGGAGLAVSNLNSTMTPQSIPIGAVTYPPPLASQRVLVADATISQPGQNNEAQRSAYAYEIIHGGFGTGQQGTSHLDGSIPAGGNLGMLDGHVEWRRFADMYPRTDSGAVPTFWW